MIRTVIRQWPLFILLLPTFVIVLINSYLPMFGVILAFKDYNYADGMFKSPWAGFDKFTFLFTSNDAWLITRNTIGYNIVFILLHLVIAVFFAVLLNEIKQRILVRTYQTLLFLPYFLSWVIVSYIGYSLLSSEHGFINATVMNWLGLDPVDWYSEAKYWPFILPLFSVWKDIGYATVIYFAAIIGFDREYYEAAVIDGASKWKQIRFITLPLLQPVVIMLLLLQIGRIFYADFGLFYQVTLNSGMLYDTTAVIDTYVYKAMMSVGDIGMASAAGLYQSIVGFVLILAANFAVRKLNKDNALF